MTNQPETIQRPRGLARQVLRGMVLIALLPLTLPVAAQDYDQGDAPASYGDPRHAVFTDPQLYFGEYGYEASTYVLDAASNLDIEASALPGDDG
jgi:hypothetical protein